MLLPGYVRVNATLPTLSPHAGLLLMHFAKHGVKHIEASHPLESSIYHYRADHANAQWLRSMHASNSPLVRWSVPPPKRPLGTRIICHGSQPTCSFCGGAHAPCPAGVVELDLPRNSTETGPTKEAAAVPLDEPFESYSMQNATLDTLPMIVHVQYDPAAVRLPGEAFECRPKERLSPDAPSPLLQALEDFTAYETCSSHLDCVRGKGPASFCDDNSHCVSCTNWDPQDPSASIDGRHPSQCDESARRHGNFQHLDPIWPIEPQSRPMRLCASCRMNASRQLRFPAMHTCPRIAHASSATALRVDDVDCTERYAQLVRCAGDSTWLFSRIEHFASGSDSHPHTQLIARELIPPSRTRDGLSASPPTFGSARLAMDDDRWHKLAANAAITCTDDGNLLLYGGGEGGTGTAWLIGEPPRTGDEYSVRRHGFRWRRPMAAWSANKSQTRCVEARPHMPELCEYDGKLTVLRYGGRVLAFTRSNLYANGGRHVQVTSSRLGFEGWSPFQQLSFEQYTTAPENNLYFAAIRAVPTGSTSCEQLLLGLFPGSIHGRGGVYVSVSTDSVNWGALRQVHPSEVHASWRTSDHPVDGVMTSTDVANLSIVLQHGVAVPHRRRTTSSPSEEPTDERAQAWCNARRPPIYCEYTFPWSVSRHNASHAIVRIGKLAPWLVQCRRSVVDWPSHSGTRHVHDRLRTDPSLPLLGSDPPRGAAVHAAAAPKRPSLTLVNANAVRPAPVMSFIVQYYRHPRQLVIICERLRDPRIEVIVHADSNDAEDAVAFSVATATCGALILHSDNVHEIRGYNLAVRHSRGKLIAFSQDDRIPPYGGEWVERVLAVFHLDAFARLGALGLHRGGVKLWIQPTGGAPRMRMVGSCGDTADDVTGHKWDALLSERMITPIRYVSFMNLGPIIVRRVAFDEVGGFNTSYSKAGQLGIGFDHEFIGRLWQAGWQSAVMCPSRVTAFRNGCGGKGSATNLSARAAQMLRNRDIYRQQFEAHAEKIEGMVTSAQESLIGDKQLLAQLGAVVNRCVDCEGSGDDLDALKYRSLGFDDTSACPTADVTKIVYEP